MKIGIDIGGSHIGIGLINDENHIIKKIEKEMDEYLKKDLLNYIDSNINNLMREQKIEFIGIVTPGNVKQNSMMNLVNLGIDMIAFDDLLKKYNIPFRIKNDAKAAAIAEKEIGALKGYKDSVFLCLGTGIGAAVFLNDKLLCGNKNIGFELGHMIIDKNGLECKCGKRGCFETYCSIKRFKENVKKILNNNEMTNEDILKITKEKRNFNIQVLIDKYINDLIVGLSNIIDIFEPEIICLGGSFVFFKEVFYNKLLDEMNNRKYFFNKKDMPKIVLAELKNGAGMIGAIL